MSSASQKILNILLYNHFTLYYLTSIARYVKDGSSARKIVNWLSSVALFKSHLCFPPTKHITQHSTGPLSRDFLTPDHVILHCSVFNWFLEYDVAAVAVCE